MEIMPGDSLMARTATGKKVPRRAVSSVESGGDFLVVWVCEEDEYERAEREGRKPNAVPWPANAVERAREATA